MKKIVLIVILALNSFVYAQEKVESETGIKINWQESFKNALIKAKNENKPILVYFTGSDWCGPCKTLKSKLFDTEEFKKFSDENLVLYKADFPKNTDSVTKKNQKINEELSERYNQDSFPTMVLIDSKGNELGRKNGIYMTEYYYPFFKEVISKYN